MMLNLLGVAMVVGALVAFIAASFAAAADASRRPDEADQ